ncbi:unnamed protein product, partial [Cyprideis torosa]
IWLAWLKPVTGHHGFVYALDHPIPEKPLHSTVDKPIAQQDKMARLAWLDELERLFLKPVGLSLQDTPPTPSPLLAGFCSVADWLGSRSDELNFCYKAGPIDDLRDYFDQKCREDAPRVLALAGINGKPKPFLGVQALLKRDYQPRQLQTLVNDLPVTPGLTIVEAPTGSGKTEMALAYAWRLLAANHADSIVFAMPTQATANAMLQRLEKIATTLFEDKPNLILAHGHARFNDNFLKLKQTGKTVQENEEAWVQCNEWLGQSRKRIFLGQIGICTVDQVLVSVLPVKHRFVRGFGVGRSVLIVDEVHAYDAYMYGLLEAVLKAQHEVGASSILLSATLPQSLKNQLLATSGKAIETAQTHAPYPLISWSDGKANHAFTLPDNEQPPLRQVQVECHESEGLLPNAALRQRIIDAAEQGAQVAIICNLVDVAQQLARDLQKLTALPVDIFHARYCLHDRQKKEDTVLKHYGAEGKRASGRILVATQVIEQSLDVDFDWLITQLCPVDLLFQRMGRLHRHERYRPTGFESARCTVLLPTGNDYGTHGLIYGNTRVMWRTAQKLQTCPDQIIDFPAAYRDWIEPVYSEEAWGTEPEAVETGFTLFEEKLAEKRILARQMLKWSEDVALMDDDENVRAVTRDGEFNVSVIPYLDTARGKQLLDSSILDSLSEWQQAEALAMNTVGVPKSWGKLLPEKDKEGRVWLAMQQGDGMNLLTDSWIPVRPQAGGTGQQISLQALLCGSERWELALPRDDMELAALQLLISLVQVLLPPADKKQWVERVLRPLPPEALTTAIQDYQGWFQVDHPDYPFMQMSYRKNNSARESLDKLFTGINTSENSKFVNEPNLVAAVCQSCCVIALFNYANNSPSFGGGPDGGFKYGIRGTCAVSTFIRWDDLRSTIWANVLSQAFLNQNIPDWKRAEFKKPTWMERIPEGGKISASSIDLLRGLFWQPGCLQLGKPIEAGQCSCCGSFVPARIDHFFRAPYGFTIDGFWEHPHSPLALTVKHKKSGSDEIFEYLRWNGSAPAWTQLSGIVVERTEEIQKGTKRIQRPALVVKQFKSYLGSNSKQVQLIVGGYRNFSAKIIERRHELISLSHGWESHGNVVHELVDHALKYLGSLSSALYTASEGIKSSDGMIKGIGFKYKVKQKMHYSLQDLGKVQFYRRSEDLVIRALADIYFNEPVPTFIMLDKGLKRICESVFAELTSPYQHDPELFRTLAIARRSLQKHIREIRINPHQEDAA